MRGDHLFDHFSSFGNVESVRVHTHATNAFGFVTFQEAEDAAKALKNQFHTIAGSKVSVELAINQYLRIESTKATQFLDLNDECLQKIFDKVTIMDLCSLAETSTRLKAVANYNFTRRYKNCNLRGVTANETRRLLINFGSLISEISTEDQEINKIGLIIRYCSGTLKSLTLWCYQINKKETIALKTLFLKLEKLVIYHFDCKGAAAKDLFANCGLLVELSIYDYFRDIGEILGNTFLNLEVFKCDPAIRNSDLHNFISRHKSLKSISFHCKDDRSPLLPIIADNCKRLEKLKISTDGHENPEEYKTAVKSIGRFNSLRKLTVSDDQNVTILLQELKGLQSLDQLKLNNVRGGSEFLSALLQLKKLNILILYECAEINNLNPLADLCQLKELEVRGRHDIVNFDLVFMIKRLIQLKKLSIRISFEMTKEIYLKIIDVVRARSERPQHTLEIECYIADKDWYNLEYYRSNCHLVKLKLRKFY